MDTENKLDPEKQGCKILELPHYVLGILLSYLDSTSLFQLSKTCCYLKEAIEDPALWKHVDARSEPNSTQKINYVIEKIHEKTLHVLLQGYKKYTNIPKTFFDKVDPFENLKVLALESIKLCGSKVSLRDFPGSLEELSLKRSYVKRSEYFFQYSSTRMCNLRVLILDECSWVTCSFLLSVSKFDNLEIISAVKCMRVHLKRLPYLNVAKFGCKKLKILDFRFTGIGGEVLTTFYSMPSIQRMYFQSYKSAEVDYDEKFKSNAKDLNRTSVDINTDLNISDKNLRGYGYTTAASSVEPITKSMLYQDPYPECGYKNGGNERTMPEPMYSLEDDSETYRPSAHMVTKFVCHRHMKDVEKLPNITSDTDSSDSDASEDYDDLACCIYAMGTKMVILPNVHEPNNRSEMDLPSSANNQPGPSGASSNNKSTAKVQEAGNADGGECSTANKVGYEKRKLDDSDSETDNECSIKKRKVRNNRESSCETVDSTDGEENEDSHHRSAEKKEKKTGQKSRNIENSDFKNETECSGSMKPDTKKMTENTRSKTCDSDSDSDTEKEEIKTLKERHKRKGKRFSDSGGGPSVKKMICETREPQIDGNLAQVFQEADHRGRLEATNDRAVEQSIFGGVRPLPPMQLQQDLMQIPHKISLRRLSLRGYKKVTKMALLYLRYLQIELLDLTYTSITKQEIENFLLYNPNCRK
nr:unnamed protein product [Callosobruchus analis]